MISKGCWQVAVPGQEIINQVDGMICDMRQHVTQPGFGVGTVQPGRADQRVDRGAALAAAVGAGEQVSDQIRPFSANGHVRVPATMMWSSTRTSTRASAWISVRVSS